MDPHRRSPSSPLVSPSSSSDFNYKDHLDAIPSTTTPNNYYDDYSYYKNHYDHDHDNDSDSSSIKTTMPGSATPRTRAEPLISTAVQIHQHQPQQSQVSMRDHPLFGEMIKVIESWDEEPIEPLLEELRKNMKVAKMISVLQDAETALRVGLPDDAEKKIAQGLDIAVEIGDDMYVQRCKELVDMVEGLRGSIALQEREREKREDADDEDETEDEDEQKRVRRDRRIQVAELTPASSPAGGENLGDFLGSDRGSQDYNDDGGNMDWSRQMQNAWKGAGSPDHASESSHIRSPPKSPVLPPAPFQVRRSVQKAKAKPRSTKSDSSSGWSSAYEIDSGDEEEDHLDSDDTLSSDDEDFKATPLTKDGKRSLSPIARSTLKYSYIQNPHQRNSHAKSRFARRNAISIDPASINPKPKPWHQPRDKVDTTRTPNAASHFWNTHSKTHLFLENSSLNQNGMSWLPKYEYSAFKLRKPKFTFQKHIPMSEMASRVRKTRIFPRQDWEVIPSQADWDAFQNGCHGTDEKITFRFLRWEQDRMKDLVRERKELGNKYGKLLVSLFYGTALYWAFGIFCMMACFWINHVLGDEPGSWDSTMTLVKCFCVYCVVYAARLSYHRYSSRR